jgi:sugar-specific transcriptional regulator TrmB
VEIILQNPSIFSAVSPKFAIEQLLKERERRLVDARNEAPQIVETLEQISLIGKKKVDMTDGLAQHHFRLKYGEQVFEKRKQLVINANEEILVICSGVGFKILAGRGWLDCFREASSRGVLIRAITEVTADNSKEIQALSHLADTRIGENLFSTLRFMVVDSSEVLLSATSVPVMEDELVALWTDNQPIARGFIEDFERCWNTSFPFLDYIAKARIK